MMGRVILSSVLLLALCGGCSFTDPLDEVATPGSPAQRLESRERSERAETARIVRCQSMDRDDPRWDAECKNRR